MAGQIALARATPRAAGAWLLPLLLGLFFLSGISALIYQVLWLRMLALVFGVTVWAISTVLASFMGGLALGSYGAGRLVDRSREPLRWFAAAEALIALSALATPWALGSADAIYATLYQAFPQQLVALTAVRFAVSTAVLIVPTTLMGATLPIVLRSSLANGGQLGARVGLLYGVNTAGAIAGTLLASFYLIGSLGIQAAFHLAAGLNLTVALAAALASRRLAGGPGERAVAAAPSAEAAAGAEASPRARRLVLVVFALSGFASMAQEVIWSRLLVYFQQINAYAFSIMLAAFLTGIAGGGLVAAWLMRRRRGGWLLPLATIELAIGVVSVAAMTSLSLTGPLVVRLQARLGPMWDTLPITVASFLALLPTTFLLGVAFPIGLRVWTGDGLTDEPGRRIGVFYALNLLGSILGALVAGFVLIPIVGTVRSLEIVAAISGGAGLLLLTALPRRQALPLAALGCLLFAAAVGLARNPHDVILDFRYREQEVVWREEGVQTTVSVHRLRDNSLAMFLDGHNQATDAGVGVHRAIGTLPVAIHPRPERALVIGLGGGATAGAIAAYPGLRLDVVELSGSVARGSDLFRHVNGDVLRRPGTRLLVEDGRNHLRLTDERYDVITADIIWPYHAGAGNLYSREYFQLARQALREDGLMLQWVGMLQETQHKLVMRTFLDVFPEATLWSDGQLLVGTRRPLRLDAAALERKLSDPAARQALATIGVTSLDALLGLYWAGPEELRRYVGPGPLLTDDQPMIEYFMALPRGEHAGDVSGVRGDPRRLLAGS